MLLTIGLASCAPSAPAPASSPKPTPRPAAAATAPSPAARGASSTAVDAAIAEDLAADRALPWSATRRLVWSNFQGRPPLSGNEGARTAYGLYYAWSCKGQVFSYRVVAAFHPHRSWVKTAVVNHITENPRVLRHEQTHFDITEVFARRMRKQFSGMTRPCAESDAGMKAVARRLVDEERRTQQRYDKESNHGLIEARQTDWNVEVTMMLREVERYAQ